MLDNATVEKLKDMHLNIMAKEFQAQTGNRDIGGMSFEERFGMLVDAEWDNRKNNRMARLIRAAGYPEQGASLEGIEYHADRELDKALITRLGMCGYIKDSRNVIMLGATGSGKTYISNALGMAANRKFYSSRYIRLPELLMELAFGRADGSYKKILKSFKAVDLLILDDWLLYPLKEADTRELLEIAEARCKTASTIFCSQMDVPGWHDRIGESSEPTLADAICDRIVHNSYRITIKGESMRQRKSLQNCKD